MNTLEIINDVYQLVKKNLRDKVILSKEDSEDLQQNVALWILDLLRTDDTMTVEEIYKKIQTKIYCWIEEETQEVALSNSVYKLYITKINDKAYDEIYNLSVGKTLEQLLDCYTNQIITKYCRHTSYERNKQIFLLHVYGFTYREIARYYHISVDKVAEIYKSVVKLNSEQYSNTK